MGKIDLKTIIDKISFFHEGPVKGALKWMSFFMSDQEIKQISAILLEAQKIYIEEQNDFSNTTES